jgi:hypothetical protein
VRRSAVAVAAIVVAIGCGPGPIVRHGQINEPALDHVARGLERVRGLRFTTPVPGRVLDDAAVRRLLDDDLAQEFKPGELEHLTAVYARLGYLQPGVELRAVLEELYADQIAALYDPRTKTLAVTAAGLRQPQPFSLRLVSFLAGRDLIGEFMLAHELTHALQDQHFGLPTASPSLTAAQGDSALARRALVEGDAMLAGVAYLAGGRIDRDAVLKFSEAVASVPEELAQGHPNMPEIIRTAFTFQYNTGSNFAAAAYLRGGWPAIDRAFGDPPTSTEQVIHPERYFDARDQPTTIALGGTEPLERQGWTRVLEDTLGELDVRVLANRAFDPQRAVAIAAGWDGDRLRALVRGDELAIVWLTAWDSAEDARDFADAVPAMITGATVERRAARVLVVVGPTRAVAPRVWAASRFAEG